MKENLTEHIVDRLKDKGHKITGARYLIIKYLAENRIHPSPEQIFEAVKKQLPNISLASVYNTLSLLQENGLIKELNVHRHFSNFDIDTSRHFHFVCTKCGNIYDLFEEKDIEARISIKTKDFSQVEDMALTIYGVCKNCRQKGGDY